MAIPCPRDRSFDAIDLHDFAGSFLDANDTALNLWGYKREEIPAVNFASLLSVDQMPQAFGALEKILQKTIIVSGFRETERVIEAQSLGAGAYVRKPYLMERLGMAVQSELDR